MSSESQFPEPPPLTPDGAVARRGGKLRMAGIALSIAVVGALAGFVVTRAGAPALANTTASSSKPSPSPSTHKPSFGPRGGSSFACGGAFGGGGFNGGGFGGPAFFGGGFCGGATGTVTQISGSTITLRTLTGTLTVTTSSSTKYSRENAQVNFSAIEIGEVLAVRSAPSTSTTAPKTAPTKIAATAITIQVPSVSGRVQSVSLSTITLVTSDGQLEYVTVSTSTAYHGVRGATAALSTIKAGVYVVAQGAQIALNQISADNIQVLGTLTFTPHSFPGHSSTAPAPPASAGKPV
jgi:hypothetical protein